MGCSRAARRRNCWLLRPVFWIRAWRHCHSEGDTRKVIDFVRVLFIGSGSKGQQTVANTQQFAGGGSKGATPTRKIDRRAGTSANLATDESRGIRSDWLANTHGNTAAYSAAAVGVEPAQSRRMERVADVSLRPTRVGRILPPTGGYYCNKKSR